MLPRGLSGQLRFTHRFWPLQPRAGTGSSVLVVPGRCSHALLGAWVRSESFQLRALNETSIDVKNVENKRRKLSGSTLPTPSEITNLSKRNSCIPHSLHNRKRSLKGNSRPWELFQVHELKTLCNTTCNCFFFKNRHFCEYRPPPAWPGWGADIRPVGFSQNGEKTVACSAAKLGIPTFSDILCAHHVKLLTPDHIRSPHLKTQFSKFGIVSQSRLYLDETL